MAPSMADVAGHGKRKMTPWLAPLSRGLGIGE